MTKRFSQRTGWDTSESALAQAIRQTRASGQSLIDLTVSNPTVCGFVYDSAAILGALADPAAMIYDPDPRGIRSAREAVAQYYDGHTAAIHPDHLLLTTSTSEAYSFLFRLLCDPGDSVLVAQPSYPLFDFLAGLDNVCLESYPLFYDFGWHIDHAQLVSRIGPRTRAIVLVHPNNPTGHATTPADLVRLTDICTRHGLALIVDEVFLDYGLAANIESAASAPHPCLTFIVSGLSKIAALPQMKVGWIACCGPEAERREALTRLEIIADTFLSMNSPAQHALPAWLAGRLAIQSQILLRVRKNLAEIAHAETIHLLPVEAGWNAILRLPQTELGEDPSVDLIKDAGVIVHPGSFYGMAGSRFIVISTIVPVETFRFGLKRIHTWCESQRLT